MVVTMGIPTMTSRLRYPGPMGHRFLRQRHRDAVDINLTPTTPPVTIKRSRFGFHPTSKDIPDDRATMQMHIRRDSAMRKRKVKPGMPKMPWDGNAEEDT